jgi:ATP phosphoribosyltransferase
MQEVITTLLKKAGLPVTIERGRNKVGHIEGADWVEQFCFNRPYDIPRRLNQGQFDVAIVGEDWIANWGFDFPVLLTLPVGRSGNKPVRIVLAVSNDSSISRVKDLPVGCEVATEYVKLAESFFVAFGRQDIHVEYSPGITEDKIRFGSDAIIDVTESGNSLRDNDLKVIHEIMESSTVIVANRESYADTEKLPYIDHFVRLIKGAYQASQYVMMTANVPKRAIEAASNIIGGLKGPSCSPLIGVEGWVALQSIVPREREQSVIFSLLQIGVTDIIVNREIPLIMT